MMQDAERQMYLQIVTRKLVAMCGGSATLLAVIFYVIRLSESGRSYLVLYVFLGGLIGGFVSIQQRLPSIDLIELKELAGSWLSILLAPINGGIFAIVLMLIFLAGILDGAMFPTFVHPVIEHENVFKSFVVWLSTTFPENGPDIAKLFFWSFVAGFCERFVPQIIRKTSDYVSDSGERRS